MRGVADGDVGRLEIGANHAFGRRGLFDFGNDTGVAGSDFAAQVGFEAAQLCARLRIGFNVTAQTGEIAVFLCCFDLIGFDVEDLVENVGHAIFLVGGAPLICSDPSPAAMPAHPGSCPSHSAVPAASADCWRKSPRWHWPSAPANR